MISKLLISCITYQPSSLIYFDKFKGMLCDDLPVDFNNRINIDFCFQDYSYDIKIMNNLENVEWDDSTSTIRILVSKKTNIIEEIYYYEHVTKSKLYVVSYPEKGPYSVYDEVEGLICFIQEKTLKNADVVDEESENADVVEEQSENIENIENAEIVEAESENAEIVEADSENNIPINDQS